jgi:hypothetical protein
MEAPLGNVVSGASILYTLGRHVASLFETGSTGSEQIVAMFRGDLNPTL